MESAEVSMGWFNRSKKPKNPLPYSFVLGYSIAVAWVCDQSKKLSDEAARRWHDIAEKLKEFGLEVPYLTFGKIASNEDLFEAYKETYPIRDKIFEIYGIKASSTFEMGFLTPVVLISEGKTPMVILERIVGFARMIGLDTEYVTKHFAVGLAPDRSIGLTPSAFQAVFQEKISSVCGQIYKQLESIDPNIKSEIDNKTTEEIEEEISKMYKKSLDKAKRHGGDPFFDYRQKQILPEKYEFGMNCLLDSMAYMVGGEILQMIFEEIKKDEGNYSIFKTPSGGESVPGLPSLFSVANLEVAKRAIENLRIRQVNDKYYRL